jgi:hypothetical protein
MLLTMSFLRKQESIIANSITFRVELTMSKFMMLFFQKGGHATNKNNSHSQKMVVTKLVADQNERTLKIEKTYKKLN